MNPITPAYSVIATFLILLGYTLAGYPASVLAQEDPITSPEDIQLDVDSSSEEAPTEATSSASQTTEIVTPTPTRAGTVAARDVYSTEKLMSDRVYSDFVVGPGRFQLEIAPGDSMTVQMIVTNRMGIPKRFTLTTEDMSGTGDADQAIVLLGDEIGPYSIKDYISVPHESFILEHSERATIPVTITIPADAEPGGFYGSLLTQIVSEDIDRENPSGATPSSKVVSRIGTLFFVTTPGEIDRSLELKKFATFQDKNFFTKGPINFSIVTENTGSVHVTPFGRLRIYNTLGNEVGFVEMQPWYVLPNSIRNKEVQWNREFLVGRYTAVAEINRGYDGIIDEVKYSFWVIPLELLAAVFAGFFVIFIIIRFFFSRFEFKRKGG